MLVKGVYKSETRIVRLSEDRMRWLEDELGEKDLILAFVDLAFVVNRPNALRIADRLREIYT